MAIHIKVSRRLGHCNDCVLHVLCHHDLATQSTGLRQAKRHVHHVFLVFAQAPILHAVQEFLVQILLQYDVARRASAHAFAGAFHFQSSTMGHLQKCFANTARDGCSAVVGIDEGDVDGWGVVTWTAAMPSHLAVTLDG